ncbi:MAG: hypothetical protein ACK5JT_18115 [Hyphomicrobiaceae bacterium]
MDYPTTKKPPVKRTRRAGGYLVFVSLLAVLGPATLLYAFQYPLVGFQRSSLVSFWPSSGPEAGTPAAPSAHEQRQVSTEPRAPSGRGEAIGGRGEAAPPSAGSGLLSDGTLEPRTVKTRIMRIEGREPSRSGPILSASVQPTDDAPALVREPRLAMRPGKPGRAAGRTRTTGAGGLSCGTGRASTPADGISARLELQSCLARLKSNPEFDHAAGRFPLSAGHANLACDTCHQSLNLSAPRHCPACHEKAAALTGK